MLEKSLLLTIYIKQKYRSTIKASFHRLIHTYFQVLTSKRDLNMHLSHPHIMNEVF